MRDNWQKYRPGYEYSYNLRLDKETGHLLDVAKQKVFSFILFSYLKFRLKFNPIDLS